MFFITTYNVLCNPENPFQSCDILNKHKGCSGFRIIIHITKAEMLQAFILKIFCNTEILHNYSISLF